MWNDYTSFVNMQLQMQLVSVPTHIGIQKKLLSIFGIDSEGCTIKDLHAAHAAITSKAAKKAALTTNKAKAKEKTNVKRKAATKSETKGRKAKPLSDPSNNHDTANHDHDADLINGTDSDGTDSRADENNGDRECCTHARQETLMKNHHTLIAKYEEWSKTYMLLTGSKVNGWQKTAAVLNFACSPPNFHSSWKKLSCVSKDHSAIAMRRLALINWTTWEWKNIVIQSFSHIMHTLAAAAIAKSATIMSY